MKSCIPSQALIVLSLEDHATTTDDWGMSHKVQSEEQSPDHGSIIQNRRRSFNCHDVFPLGWIHRFWGSPQVSVSHALHVRRMLERQLDRKRKQQAKMERTAESGRRHLTLEIVLL